MTFGGIAMVGGIFGLAFTAQLKKRSILPPEEAKFLKEWGITTKRIGMRNETDMRNRDANGG